MDISLLNQNTVVFFSLVAAGTTTFVLTKLRKSWFGIKGLDIGAVALLLSFIIEGLVHIAFSSDTLPTLFWLMIVPFTLNLSLIYAAWHNKRPWLKWMCLTNSLFCLLFSFILINGYYGFYPTIGSVFNDNSAAVTSPTLLHKTLHQTHDGTTVESSLYAKKTPADGVIESLTIPGPISKFNARTAYVYIPPIALQPVSISLPVVILSAGYPGIPNNWIDSGLQNTMDEFAAQHNGITPYVFMVDNTGSLTNDTECVNSPRGNVETYLTTDVPNYIKAHYNVEKGATHWAIGGLSMGGMCSMMLALRHPDVYNTFVDLGGEMGPEVGTEQTTIKTLFYGSEANWTAHQPPILLQENNYAGMNAFFADGAQDGANLISGLKAVYNLAQAAGIDSTFELIAGGHTFSVWQQTFKDSLPWLSYHVGATNCTVAICRQ